MQKLYKKDLTVQHKKQQIKKDIFERKNRIIANEDYNQGGGKIGFYEL